MEHTYKPSQEIATQRSRLDVAEADDDLDVNRRNPRMAALLTASWPVAGMTMWYLRAKKTDWHLEKYVPAAIRKPKNRRRSKS